MEDAVKAAQLRGMQAIPSVEARLKRRIDELRGKESPACLTKDLNWEHFGCGMDLRVVAVMCCRVNPDCEKCREVLRRM